MTRGIEEERGCRPVTVQFEKYTVTKNSFFLNLFFFQDKASVLQKAKMLKGTNVLVSDILLYKHNSSGWLMNSCLQISEDFPKRVRERRMHLIQFAKEVDIHQIVISC